MAPYRTKLQRTVDVELKVEAKKRNKAMSMGEEGCGYEGRKKAKIMKIKETEHSKPHGLFQMRVHVLTARPTSNKRKIKPGENRQKKSYFRNLPENLILRCRTLIIASQESREGIT